MVEFSQDEICRVCRCEAQPDRPLFYPCVCTGSIKYIHQDCLMQWIRYSRNENCELCGHRFSFQPIYSPDMPRVLPIRDVLCGLIQTIMKTLHSFMHNLLVAVAWFVVMPLSAYWTYRFLFRASSLRMLLSLPFDEFSIVNIAADVFRGYFVVTCTWLSFIGVVWLRDQQILLGVHQDWLDGDDDLGNAEENNDAQNEEEINVPADRNIGDDNNEPELRLIGIVFNNSDALIVEPINNNDPFLEFVPLMVPALARHQNNNNPVNAADNDLDEPNWNPMGMDGADEEWTWERLVGLDGSLDFLVPIFSIVSLNAMHIFAFAFCPHYIGHFILSSPSLVHLDKPLTGFNNLTTPSLVHLDKPLTGFNNLTTPSLVHLDTPLTGFNNLKTTLVGYCFIGVILVVLHFLARLFHMQKVKSFISLCHIVVKVSLLLAVEFVVLPILCGWCMDISSLSLFDATFKQRKTSFTAAPCTSLFVHWVFGMIFVYYFAAFISLLREVLRPGVLWFLINLNDPDPIEKMIQLPILKHARRLISIAMTFGSVVLLILWTPIYVLKTIWPTFLPYALSGDSDVYYLRLQLLLLQIILRSLFEQSHIKVWLKKLLHVWCVCVSRVLGIGSYLLGNDAEEINNAGNNPDLYAANNYEYEENPLHHDHPANNYRDENNIPLANEAGEPIVNPAAVHDYIHHDIPLSFPPLDKPTLFPIRLCGLFLCMCISLVVASLITLTFPVWIGRQVMSLWSVEGTTTGVKVTPKPHELYTAALGTYLCWMLTRAIGIAVTLLPQGRAVVLKKLKLWLKVGASYALPVVIIIVLLLGVIPLLFGLLLKLIVKVPVRVEILQTPIYSLWTDWTLGVLYTKIAIALTLMGPDWHLKRALEKVFRDGIRDIDIKFIITELAIPVIMCLGLALALPNVFAHSILPLFCDNPWIQLVIEHIYPATFTVMAIIGIIDLLLRKFKNLYVAIKMEKYLIGQRLLNYEHRKKQQEVAETTTDSKEADGEQENVPIENISEQAIFEIEID